MTDAEINQLRIVLLALLPADGRQMTVAALAKAAGMTPHAVTSVLADNYFANRIDFDARADAYSARKTGDAL